MSEPRDSVTVEAPSRTKLVRATLIALLIAVIILVTIVLPAEFGEDPLGTGQALGLVGLSDAEQALQAPPVAAPALPGRGIAKQPAEYKLDSTEFKLGPYGWIEYKYRLELGGTMLYSWKASAPVVFDMHSEPEGAPAGTAESFEQGESDQANGTYTAPFPGIHGWYWENPTEQDVTVRLTTAGFYSSASEYHEIGPTPHEVMDIQTGMKK